MSDDEDEGMLRIVESPSEDQQIAPLQPKPLQERDTENRKFSNSGNIIISAVKDDSKEKEEGEIDDDESMDTAKPESPHPPSTTVPPVVQCFDMPNIEPLSTSAVSSSSVEKSTTAPKEELAEVTPKASRKRKDLTGESPAEKRKSNEMTTPTNHRSKRTSHQVASAAITACLDEEEMDVQSEPTHSYSIKSHEATSSHSGTKRQKKDASTNCCEKNEDTSDIADRLSIMDAPPGTRMVIEVTVMYRCTEHLAFRTKGKDCEIYGILSDSSSKMHAGIAAKRKALPPGKTENGVVDENHQGSSSSKGVNGNGRSGRGNSQVRDHHHHHNKHDKRKDVKKRNPKEGDEDIDVCYNDDGYSHNLKVAEVDTREMHDCHFEGCSKRFHLSSELNYHITKFHKRKVVITDTIACQTNVSSFDIPSPEVSKTSPQTAVEPSPMPILRKEPMNMPSSSPIYSDLSDDDETVKKAIEKNQTNKKPLTVPLQPASTSNLSTPSSSGTTGVIGISGAMKNNIVTPAAIRNSAAFGAQPSRPQSQVHVPIQSSSLAPPPMAHPNMPFIPGFHPGLLHPGMMSQFQPSSSRDGIGGSHQTNRTPSRQQQEHKIHELTKEQPRAGGAGGSGTSVKPSHLQPKVAPSPAVSTPSRAPAQFLTPSQAQHQQQQALFQYQQMQMAARGMQLPTQSELMMYQMMNPLAFSQMASQPPPPSQQNPPK